jgi:hypothetical protein
MDGDQKLVHTAAWRLLEVRQRYLVKWLFVAFDTGGEPITAAIVQAAAATRR